MPTLRFAAHHFGAGLALMVQEALKRDPYKGDLNVFRGRRGRQARFCIRFALSNGEGDLPLSPAVRRTLQVSPFRRGKELWCA